MGTPPVGIPIRDSRRIRSRALPSLVLASTLAILGVATIDGPRADAGWWDDLDKGESVTLSDLCAEPSRWSGKVVTFACIYNEPAEIYSPYFTSFNAEKYENVTAWLDGAPLWDAEAFQRDDFPFLYLPRTHTQRNELFRLPAFTRIEITGKVKDVYRQRPWIEIQAFRVTAATLGRDVVHFVKDGDGYAAQLNYVRAEANYRRALNEIKLADVYRMRIEKKLAFALRAAGKDLDASKVEGPSPILGAGDPSHPDNVGTGLPDARSPGAPAVSAAPPGELTSDLPGDPAGAPVRPASPAFLPARIAPPVGPVTDPGFHPVAPALPGSVAPPSEITSDLPGTPSDAGPAPAPANQPLPPPSALPPMTPLPQPTALPPMTPLPPPVARPMAPLPPLPIAPVAPPLPTPVTPAPAPTPTQSAPPPPPPREPRLSGVK